MNKSYSEALTFQNYGDRLNYLKVQDLNYQSPREYSDKFWKSKIWREFRYYIIKRDLGQDLAIQGFYIEGDIIVHHINPITKEDILNMSPKLLDPENVICVSLQTHNAIHYIEKYEYVEREKGDTTPWSMKELKF